MATLAKLGRICLEQSFLYMIVKRIQRKKAKRKKRPGNSWELCSTKPMCWGPKDQEE